MENTQWKNLLQSTKACDLVGDQKLFTINAGQTIKDCLNMLKDKDITGLPVLENGRPLGLVDVLDISAYALYLWRNYAHSGKFSEFLEKNKFFDTDLRKIINFSGRNTWHSANFDSTLFECLERFRSRQFKTHRLPLINNNGEVVKVLSIWDVVKFGAKNLNNLDFGNKDLLQLGIIHPCIMIRHDCTLIDALSTLVDNQISGLALVDWENKLVGNFSASDLRGIFHGSFDLFDRPILDFLRQGTQTKTKIPPICLSNTNSFGDVLKTMTTEKVHRIFLNDRSGRFYGILSCTDVVQSLSPKLSTSQMVTSE